MSIAAAIIDLSGRIQGVYDALETMGAPMPASRTLQNLSVTVDMMQKSADPDTKIISLSDSNSPIYTKFNVQGELTALPVDKDSILYIYAGNDVSAVGNDLMGNASRLFTAEISPKVKTINDGAFYNCSELRDITLRYGLESIGRLAFNGCSKISSIQIPNSVTSIGDGAFRICSGLKSIMIPNSVTSIGNTVFYGCTALENAIIPDSVTDIGDSMFQNCTSLSTINIPNSVSSIYNSAFYGCTNLISVVIPDGVSAVGLYAFSNCSNLKYLYFAGQEAFNAVPDTFSNVHPDCTLYVSYDSTGWGVDIPGTWNGIKIDYNADAVA